jgi:hypothetical protein
MGKPLRVTRDRAVDDLKPLMLKSSGSPGVTDNVPPLHRRIACEWVKISAQVDDDF